MNQSLNFTTVPDIAFGTGRSSELGDVVRGLDISKPLIVTDAGIVEHHLLDSALSGLAAHSIEASVYADVVADPSEENVLGALELARGNRCDGVVGFGGGSSMDVAKLVAALLGGTQTLAEMYGVDMISGSRVPLIQVPTTAGTGSEVTSVAIVTTGESTKAGVVSKVLFADSVILDPDLTLGLPPHVTAATGIDAMVHAIEAYTSKRLKNPMSDMVALKALSLMSSTIHIAVHQGDNHQARSDMLLGAMLAGQAFANAPVGAVHALAYPLGGTYHIPHGLSNSLVLPYVLRFNAPAAADLYQELAPAILGAEQEPTDTANVADLLADHFLNLATELGLQTTLRQMDIGADALPMLAEQAMLQQRLLINNPREVQLEDALAIYQQAY